MDTNELRRLDQILGDTDEATLVKMAADEIDFLRDANVEAVALLRQEADIRDLDDRVAWDARADAWLDRYAPPAPVLPEERA